MIKFLSKIIAKSYLENHKTDSKALGVGNTVVKGIDLYQDMFIYILLYAIGSLLLLIGVPIGIYSLGGEIGWSIFSFFASIIVCVLVFFKLLASIIVGVRDELDSLRKTLMK